MAGRDLPARLKELRLQLGATQDQLAHALEVSEPLISSWEKSTAPPDRRLQQCATVFATYRLDSAGRLRPLPSRELTEDIRARERALERELVALGRAARSSRPAPARRAWRSDDLWRFPESSVVTIVCGLLGEELRKRMPYTHRSDPDYVRLYNYSDPDSLIELYGYLRATNPRLTIGYKLAVDLTEADYTTDLALLGGVDFNHATRRLLAKINSPVTQVVRNFGETDAAFVEEKNRRIARRFAPALQDETIRGKHPLIWDVAQFIRGRNPFNQQRTFTICNGLYGRGVLGAVRALTDGTFRERNTQFVRQTFPADSTFSVLFKVEPYEDTVHTPDWTQKGTVLHTWSDPAPG
jgi:transcriptional regulator with XRE-family HTH domain